MGGSRQSPGFASQDSFYRPSDTIGLPRVSQWPVAISSLTVARQRGILTRFPPQLVDEDARTKDVEKERKAFPGFCQNPGNIVTQPLRFPYFTITWTGAEGIPLATTTRVLAPVSALLGTSKLVDTIFLPVAIAMVL